MKTYMKSLHLKTMKVQVKDQQTERLKPSKGSIFLQIHVSDYGDTFSNGFLFTKKTAAEWKKSMKKEIKEEKIIKDLKKLTENVQKMKEDFEKSKEEILKGTETSLKKG